MRTVIIEKIGKSTYVETSEEQSKTIVVINKLANLRIVNDVLCIESDDISLKIQYAEIQNKLASTDIVDYIKKASEIFLFNQ